MQSLFENTDLSMNRPETGEMSFKNYVSTTLENFKDSVYRKYNMQPRESSFNIFASMTLDCFVDTVYRHYAMLPSLGKMDQWSMNKAINIIRGAPVREIEDNRWHLEINPMDKWSHVNTYGDPEVIPLSLNKPQGESHDKMYNMLWKLGVEDEDIEKLTILSLFDRLYHDDEGKLDPNILLRGIFDPNKEQISFLILEVMCENDGVNTVPLCKTDITSLENFYEKKQNVLQVFPRAHFESLIHDNVPRRISLKVLSSQQ